MSEEPEEAPWMGEELEDLVHRFAGDDQLRAFSEAVDRHVQSANAQLRTELEEAKGCLLAEQEHSEILLADLAAQKATNAAQAERVAELTKGVVELREALGKIEHMPGYPKGLSAQNHSAMIAHVVLASTARLVPARDEQKENGQ